MNIENTTDNLPKPEQFTNKLSELQGKMDPILEDFKKYYVFYNKILIILIINLCLIMQNQI